MIVVFVLLFAHSLVAADKTPYEEALDEITHERPYFALSEIQLIDDPQEKVDVFSKILSGFTRNDFDDNELTELGDTLAGFFEKNPKRIFDIPFRWRTTLFQHSKKLMLLLTPAPVGYEVTIPEQTKKQAPTSTQQIALESRDKGRTSIPLDRTIAENFDISRRLSRTFKGDPTRLYVRFPQIEHEVLRNLAEVLKEIDLAYQQAKDQAEIARRTYIIATANRAIDAFNVLKNFIDDNIYSMIKAADVLESPYSTAVFMNRLHQLKKPATDIQKNLDKRLWPEWLQKG